jgi:hypothetical protein
MLSTQESLDAMAGRSPDGMPLVFVSQRDHDALRKKYEELLLKTEKQRKAYWRWQVALVVTIASIVVAVSIVAARSPRAAARIEPFGRYFYASNDAVGVHTANAFCSSRSQNRQMQPVNGWGANGLVFECIESADEIAADERAAAKKDAEPWQFTPSPEHLARCVELRDQLKATAKNDKLVDLMAEEEALKCWSKP